MQTQSNPAEIDFELRLVRVQWAIRGAFALLGLLDCWLTRFSMGADGISYLDMGDQYWKGNWHAALNAYWSPLYGWLTGLMFWLTRPSLRWEYPEVHLLNFVIFLAALASFEFFWRGMLKSRTGTVWTGASRLYAWVLGYLLFAILMFGFGSMGSISGDELTMETPDLLVATLALLALGLVLRFSAGRLGVGSSCLMGVTLGVGYLAKSVMLPFGLVVLATMFAVCWVQRRGWLKAAAATLCFLAIASAFIAAISWNNHRFTFGDAGKMNVAWKVNGAWPPRLHWQGRGDFPTHPLHPTRKLMNWPEVYEFGAPVAGTYPVWYDPTYWWAGVDTRMRPSREIARLLWSMEDLGLYLVMPAGMLMAAVLGIFLLSDRIGNAWRQLIGFLPILAPAIALVTMYALLNWWPRYVFWAFLIGLCALVASSSISAEAQRVRAFRAATVILGVLLVAVLLQDAKILRWQRGIWLQLVEEAEQLRAMGLEPGNRVALIGDGSVEEIWARLDGVKIVAEVPHTLETGDSDAAFWNSSPEIEQAVLNTLQSTGAKAVVADLPPKVLPPGWAPIGHTGHAVYFFR